MGCLGLIIIVSFCFNSLFWLRQRLAPEALLIHFLYLDLNAQFSFGCYIQSLFVNYRFVSHKPTNSGARLSVAGKRDLRREASLWRNLLRYSISIFFITQLIKLKTRKPNRLPRLVYSSISDS